MTHSMGSRVEVVEGMTLLNGNDGYGERFKVEEFVEGENED